MLGWKASRRLIPATGTCVSVNRTHSRIQSLRFHMLHVVAQARPGTLIFRDWKEGLLLWRALAKQACFHALVVMPDHLHALVKNVKDQQRLVPALVGYAQARNAGRGEHGPVWSEGVKATPVGGIQHVRRSVRYLHLNPTRRGLVKDPLAWPLSTHRDFVGLAIPATRIQVRNPERFHEWVSADPSVKLDGTALPESDLLPGAGFPSLESIRTAVVSLTRRMPEELCRRGAARTLLIQAARELSDARPGVIARFAGVERSSVRRTPAGKIRDLRLVERVLEDSRFFLLQPGDLRREPFLQPYRHRC